MRDEFARQVAEELAQLRGGGFGIRADDGERRLVVVAYRGALAQEFRLEADVEVDAVLLARFVLDDGPQHVLDGAGDERGAKNENVRRGLVAHRRAEILREPEHRRLILAAVGRRRRADADERDLARQDGFARIAGDRHPSAGDDVRHEVDHAFLDHRRPSCRNEVELGLVHVHADHVVAVAREARKRDGPYITQSEDAYFH